MAPLTVVFDPDQCADRRASATAPPGAQGPGALDTEEEFSDFRDVSRPEGRRSAPSFAWPARTPFAGRLHRVEYNVPLDPALFSLQS